MTPPQQSNAERFVEELQLEANVQELEESLVVGSIDELRSRLAALQAEVCARAAAALVERTPHARRGPRRRDPPGPR